MIRSESIPPIAYYGHGKLLLSGEYFVLDGAKALALPTRFGQSFNLDPTPFRNHVLYWQSYDYQNNKWLNLQFDLIYIECLNSEDEESKMLEQILREARKLNPRFLVHQNDLLVESYLEFPSDWGLGSSSTLISFISKWAKVDPYELLHRSFGGSGYDLACADAEGPVYYQLKNGDERSLETAAFQPSFKEHLYFVHLNQKQSSREAIKMYESLDLDGASISDKISSISERMVGVQSLTDFEALIVEHESIVGDALNLTPVKTERFPDYWGQIKSLGAWGGDFILATSERKIGDVKDYFEAKNLNSILTYEEMIL